jgi:Fe-S oxidoreductase
VGACRKQGPGVMCPSYRATGEEMHSTRGRAHLLWEMLAGDLQHEGFQSDTVNEALSLCLSCKACKTECPVQVDMAQYKSEFLAQRYKGRLHPLHHYVFGFADKLARWGALAPWLTNAILTGPLTSPLIKRIAGVAQQRQLPKLAPQSFQRSRASDPQSLGAPSVPVLSAEWVGDDEPQLASFPQTVLLWPDTWNNYYRPQSLAAAESVLIQAGFRVHVAKGHICCGRPLYDFGLLDAARSYLANVLTRMAPQIDSGLPFIFLEPSCASVFRDELPELFPNDSRAQKLRDSVWLLADWLAAKAPDFAKDRLKGETILVHGHCHHKAVFGGPKSEIALLRQAGATVEAIQAGCCGMAGPFGFEAEKYEVSKTIANQDLLPALRAASPDTIIVADGFSCREQIDQLAHKRAVHFAEALAGMSRSKQ